MYENGGQGIHTYEIRLTLGVIEGNVGGGEFVYMRDKKRNLYLHGADAKLVHYLIRDLVGLKEGEDLFDRECGESNE